MLKNRIIYAIAVSSCFAFSMMYESKISAVMLAAVIIYPFAAALLTAIQLLSLKADFSERRLVCDKCTPFDYFITVKNGSVIPCVPMEIICTIPSPDNGRIVKKRMYVSLAPLAAATLSVTGKHLYRGCYTASIDRIAVSDPLRIIRISKKAQKQMTMVFLPRKLSLEDVEFACAGEQDFTKQSSVIADKDDFSHVREYHNGENIQLVHWKLSAKQDELMLKQYDSVSDRRAMIICGWSGDNGDTYLRTDIIIETAVAFADALLRNDVKTIVQPGKAAEYQNIPITNRAEFESFFDVMSVLPVVSDSSHEEFIELVSRSNSGGAAAMVLITSELSEKLLMYAEEMTKSTSVYLAYVNIASRHVDKQLYSKPYLFFNICGSGQEALKLAAAMAKQ